MFIILTNSETGVKVRLNASSIVAYWKQPDNGITAVMYGHGNIAIGVKETVEEIDKAVTESYITIKEVAHVEVSNGSTSTIAESDDSDLESSN